MAKRKITHEDSGNFGVPDDKAWRRSYSRLPVPLGVASGVPARAFGRIFVHGVSPDFETNVALQKGNRRPTAKVKLLRSWEIRGDNYVGSMISYQPSIPANDFQPQTALCLIDGDPETAWCSRGEGQPDVAPAWVRIDLPIEESLKEIVLLPRKDKLPWPKELTIKLSRDAWHWDVVFDTNTGAAVVDGEPVRVALKVPTAAKQIWVIGNQLPPDAKNTENDHVFSFAGVQAITESGENVALLSRGAGVTVSSSYINGGDWMLNDLMWPMQYDLGAKWIRLSGGNPPWHHDTLQWRFVEQKRGHYIIDEKTRLAMVEARANGCKVIVQMAYGNWLYTTEPEKQVFDPRVFPAPFPAAPITRKHIEGYKKWFREMVKAYKGAVDYWEIYNEPIGFGWDVIPEYEGRVRQYCDLAKEVIPIIRKADPDVKISLAGMAGVPGGEVFHNPFERDWLRDCLNLGMGPLVDLLQWHIQCTLHPDVPDRWAAYPDEIRKFQRDAEAAGFRGKYAASEYWIAAPYPRHKFWAHPAHWQLPGETPPTEIQKAKNLARTFTVNAGLGVATIYCNTWWAAPRDCGIFRITWGADPISPQQPQPAYYAMRTLGTVLEGLKPAEFDVQFSAKGPFDRFTFRAGASARVVAVWLPGASVDKHPGVATDVDVAAPRCRKVVGIDTLNGFEQELSFERRGDRVHIPAVLVRDYPLLLRLETR